MTSQNQRRRVRKKPRNPEGVMTIVQHIQELRSRLLKALVGLFFGTVAGFMWYQTSFTLVPWRIPFSASDFGPWHFMSLGEILKGPYCALPAELRFGGAQECRLLATSPFEMFLLRMKVGAIAGLVLSAPWWLYQIWAYITPGLVHKERRNTLIVVFLAACLFAMGAVLAYVVIAYGLEFLLQIGDNAQTAALTGERYFNFILGLILVFGVSFEVPLFIVMLNIVGILPYESMKDKRRVIIVLLFVFAAFMTPGQDPVSMIAMAVSLSLLVELALQFCRFNDRRRKQQRPEWLDIDDESGSGPIAAPTSVDTSFSAGSPVASPQPVASTIAAPSRVQRATRNSRPPRPQPEPPASTPNLASRPVNDFDDVM